MISIVIPVYNAEKYLERCVESILLQKTEKIELIIVDDGSSDTSLALCKKIAEHDLRVKVLSQENRGVSAARNKGLDVASGEWIMFADADDYWEPDMLQKAVPAMEGNDLLIFNYNKISQKGCECCDTVLNCIWDKHSFMENCRSNLNSVYYNKVYNKVYKRKIIVEKEIRFPDSIKIGEDLAFNIQYFEHCKSIRCLPEYLYNYRVDNRKSLMHTADDRKLSTALFCADQVISFFERNRPNIANIKKELDSYVLALFWEVIRSYAKECDVRIRDQLMVEAIVEFSNRFEINHFEGFRFPALLRYSWVHHSSKAVYLRWRIIDLRYRAIMLLKGRK